MYMMSTEEATITRDDALEMFIFGEIECEIISWFSDSVP